MLLFKTENMDSRKSLKLIATGAVAYLLSLQAVNRMIKKQNGKPAEPNVQILIAMPEEMEHEKEVIGAGKIFHCRMKWRLLPCSAISLFRKMK